MKTLLTGCQKCHIRGVGKERGSKDERKEELCAESLLMAQVRAHTLTHQCKSMMGHK